MENLYNPIALSVKLSKNKENMKRSTVVSFSAPVPMQGRIWLDCWSVGGSVSESVCRSVCRLFGLSVGWSVGRSVEKF